MTFILQSFHTVDLFSEYGTRLPEELREELRRSIEPADAPASPMHYAR